MSKFIILCILCSLLIAGCQRDNPIESGPPFQMTIRDQDGHVVAGATIEGGFDQDLYSVQSNSSGVATLPGSARGKAALIFKTNYLPVRIDGLYPTSYTLRYTPRRLDLIGETRGQAISFGPAEISTIDGAGNYRVYSYTDQSVSLTFEQRLLDSTNAVREVQLHGDTLWFSTHDSGLYVFSLRVRTDPQLLFRLRVPGYLGAFAVKDSLVILGSPYVPGPLRFIDYSVDGTFHELSQIDNYWVRQMRLFENCLLLFGGYESLPTVLDVSNPTSPVIVYNGLEWNYQRAVIYGRQVILVPGSQQGYYKALDFSNPRNPGLITAFGAGACLLGFSTDSIAYGYDYIHNSTYTLNKGEYHSEYFQTIATVSEGTYNGVGGTFHPYYIIGDRFWKLVNR
jgi:hypothetical protein